MSDKPSPIELQKALSGADYPASKDDLVRRAEDNGAAQEIVERLKEIPDREYDGPTAVSKEFASA